jgi:hypothetical protein
MATWNGWTDKQRNASAYWTKKAIERGEIPARPSKCERCGQTEGVLEWHNSDYSDPVKYLVGLCYQCHMTLHREQRFPEACQRYWDEIDKGKMSKPHFKKR